MRLRKLAIGTAVAIAVIVAISRFGGAVALAHAMHHVRGLGALGVLLYALLFVASAVLLLPMTPVFVAAGLLYGVVWGVVLLTVLSVGTDLLTIALVHTRARRWIERRRQDHKTLAAADEAVRQHSLALGTLLRLSLFVPFGPLNYALAATAMPLWQHVVTNVIGMTPCNLLTAYAGSLLADATCLDRGALPWPWPQIALWGGLGVTLAASIAIGVAIGRERQSLRSGHVVREHEANA